MPAPSYSDADFLTAYQGLLPTGPVWPREPDAVQTQTFLALAKGYTRNATSAGNLLVDAFPATTTELLPEWEKTLGLPDPCTPLGATVEQRRAAVLAKFISFGGQSIAYYVAVANALGYFITVTELGPYQWMINAPTVTVSYFELGSGVCGDPFWSIGNHELECRIRQIMPAHTVLTFSYGSGLLNDGGVLTLAFAGGYPTSASGLAAGAFWSNGGVVSVVPGAIPNPAAPPIIWSDTSAAILLVVGGGNLPLTSPPVGSGQLWNSGGEVWIA